MPPDSRSAASPLRRLLVAFLLALVPLAWLAHDYWTALARSARLSPQSYHAKLQRSVRRAIDGANKDFEEHLSRLFKDIDTADDPVAQVKDLADDDIVKLAIAEEDGPPRRVRLASRFKTVKRLGVGNSQITYDEPREIAPASLDGPLRFMIGQELARSRAGQRPADRSLEILSSLNQTQDGLFFFLGRRSVTAHHTWLIVVDHRWVQKEIAQRALDREGLEDQVRMVLTRDVPADGLAHGLAVPDQMPRNLGYLTPIEQPEAFKTAQDKVAQGRVFTTVWFATLLFWATAALGRLYRTAREDVALAEMKANFVSAISHELKTPLAMIKMYSEMLLLGLVGEGKKPEEYHGIIIHETDRLTRLIDNVLDFSKIQKGTKTYVFEPVDLAESVAAAFRTMEPVFEREGIAFGCDVPPGTVAKADRDAAQQALLNLLSNAVKYGGKAISVQASRRGKFVHLAVTDSGPGIPKAERAKIFRPFYRMGREEERTAQGTGLGLALVAEIMKAHGGDVKVLSRPGQGATFTLIFPHDKVVQNPVQSVTTPAERIRTLEP